MKRLSALFATCATLAAPAALAEEDVMVVFDGSNSMWGQIDGVAKIEIARDVMDNLLGEWTTDRQVGLMAYGHRRRGDCTDIETLIAPATGTSGEIQAQINAITPTGKTPLTDAVEMAAQQLAYTDRPATVVLISDGLESCERDPCALARALEKGGVGFTAHVVGFGLGGDADAASLACIAEETGGQFIQASNASELGEALSTVGTAVAAAPEPEPEPEPELPEIRVTAPETAFVGSLFEVSWDKTPNPKDFVTVMPVGADEATYKTWTQTGGELSGMLRAQSQPGAYEVRYLDHASYATLGRTTIELVDPDITLTAPGSVLTGTRFEVSWTGAVHPQDYVTIVPAGADQGSYGSYELVEDKDSGILQAAADPGMYELRYVLAQDARTMVTQPIELLDPEVTLSGPETALAGSKVEVSWTGAVDPRDYVTIVPMGADEGTNGRYVVVREDTDGQLQMPAETGVYELRYVLRTGARTLARQTIEITAPEVTVSGPEAALAGSKVKVAWTGAVHPNDYVTIVPMGADEGTNGRYVVVREDTEGQLQMPAETGMYELRYVLREGAVTMARQPVEITAPEVTVSGPEAALAGSKVKIAWTGAVHPNDYVTIVPMGADEGTNGRYVVVREDTEGQLQMPAETGMYELRYVLREGAVTMARQPVEITAPEVTVSGPHAALAGSKVKVAWTGAVHPNDYVTIVPMGADEGTSDKYIVVRGNSEGQLQMPAETGMYELRYVLREGAVTMARQPVEITMAEVTVDGPDTATAGARIDVSWTGTVSPNDFIAIVPMGYDGTRHGHYVVARDDSEGLLQVPAAPGMYELRYVLREGSVVMASKPIEITEPEVTISGPDQIRAGDRIRFSWTGSVHRNDYVRIAPMGSDDDTRGDYVNVRDATEGELNAPEQTGFYELRYTLREGGRVVARHRIEVLAEDAALNSGASLTAPDTATRGSTVEVGWQVENPGGDQRITLARGDQAIFTWITAIKTAEGPPVQMPMPDEPGSYELRFLDVSNQEVLARKVILVE